MGTKTNQLEDNTYVDNFYHLYYTFLLFTRSAHASERPNSLAEGINPGTLEVKQIGGEKPDKKLEMPLKHTDVKIEISGFVASATVTIITLLKSRLKLFINRAEWTSFVAVEEKVVNVDGKRWFSR
ncbi:MAG: hypothetical protein ABFS56_28150 [Pseudomonadota bacterium]